MSNLKKNKKGIELPMQIIVVVIILLVLLVFLLIFFTGQSGKLTGLWDSLVGTSINQTQAATTP
jgi:flagellar basal body-associated protein FliL